MKLVSSDRKAGLGAALRNNCGVTLSVFTCLHYRLHSATQLLLLESSLAARVCIHPQPALQKECLRTDIRLHKYNFTNYL